MRSPYRTNRSSFSISNFRETKFRMILSRSAREFIRRRRKSLPFNLESFPFAVIPRASVSRLILTSRCVVIAANDSTSASLASISWAVPARDVRSKAFLACKRFLFFFLRISCFSRILAIARSAIFLLCPEIKSVGGSLREQLTNEVRRIAVLQFAPSTHAPRSLMESQLPAA